jgi:predicted nucleic acid-binding protein
MVARVVVALDANVLVAAMLSPTGASRRLMHLAAMELFCPIITSEVLAEAERHFRKGIGGRIITDAEVEAYQAALAPLLEPESLASSPVGRVAAEGSPLVNVDNRAILQVDPGRSGHPRGQRRQTEAVGGFHALLRDMGDAHVLAAAVRHRCDYLCTGNTQDFPADFEFQGIRAVTPRQLLAELLREDDEEGMG